MNDPLDDAINEAMAARFRTRHGRDPIVLQPGGSLPAELPAVDVYRQAPEWVAGFERRWTGIILWAERSNADCWQAGSGRHS